MDNSEAEEYVSNARECLRAAAQTKDELARQQFLQMARDWMKLAERKQRRKQAKS